MTVEPQTRELGWPPWAVEPNMMMMEALVQLRFRIHIPSLFRITVPFSSSHLPGATCWGSTWGVSNVRSNLTGRGQRWYSYSGLSIGRRDCCGWSAMQH
ncbi:hypothetical protein CDAR_185531 [Caerostris darwini]|uniref:Uncharacterized protein n=1 Tax=Caerostris darwini TaxID=1538125 RepID=A0AAV4NDT5_9ARAC|nr:hypothetical protein CDAR_185531 [Caerostris darwini]